MLKGLAALAVLASCRAAPVPSIPPAERARPSAAAAAHAQTPADAGALPADGAGAISRAPPDAPALAPLDGVMQIAAGGTVSCAVMRDRTVRCWGARTPFAETIDGVAGVAHVAVGYAHACALLEDKTIACWGDGGSLEFADDEVVALEHAKPARIRGLAGVVQLAAGEHHVCVVTEGNHVTCTKGGYGEAGFWGIVDQSRPPRVVGFDGVRQVAAGPMHSCGLFLDSSVSCVGENRVGEIGDGTRIARRKPTRARTLFGVKELAAGGYYQTDALRAETCVLMLDATVKCWGYNRGGALGDGTTTDRAVATTVPGLRGVLQIALGCGEHACALLASGAVSCWGVNDEGQLGDGTSEPRLTPTPVAGLAGVGGVAARQVSVGRHHSCALLADGTARCWGGNDAGQLGDGTTEPRRVPSVVQRLGP